MSKQPTGRVLPPGYKYTANYPFHFTVGWKDKLKLMLGYSMVCEVMFISVHNPGGHRCTMKARTSKEVPAKVKLPENLFPPDSPMQKVSPSRNPIRAETL